MGDLDALSNRLGHRFDDRGLLERALTHRSFGPLNNERFEFLGDSLVGCVIARELHDRFPNADEGRLTRLRTGLVREEKLASIASNIGLAPNIRLGEGERSRVGAIRESILADAMEALFGAVFLDAGYDAARAAVLRVFSAELDDLGEEDEDKDPKTRLQEWVQGRHERLPVYRIVSVTGAAHAQSFEVECLVPDAGLAETGSGTSRRRAEQQAAARALARLGA